MTLEPPGPGFESSVWIWPNRLMSCNSVFSSLKRSRVVDRVGGRLIPAFPAGVWGRIIEMIHLKKFKFSPHVSYLRALRPFLSSRNFWFRSCCPQGSMPSIPWDPVAGPGSVRGGWGQVVHCRQRWEPITSLSSTPTCPWLPRGRACR